MKELNGWPREDANVILIIEIILMSLFLTMNTADLALQSRGAEHYTPTAPFWITSHFSGMFAGQSIPMLLGIERGCWWMHIIGVFFFLNYLPYSKHFHILLVGLRVARGLGDRLRKEHVRSARQHRGAVDHAE